MTPLCTRSAAMVLALIAPAANAGEHHRFGDYAQVMDVTPVVEQSRIPVIRTRCEPGESLRLQILPADPPAAATLAQDIRRQQGLASARGPACRAVQAYEIREQILGYDVRYRYRGRIGVQRMDHRPGDRVPVQVVLEPVP